MDRFKRVIKGALLQALDTANMGLDSRLDIESEIDDAMADLESFVKSSIDRAVTRHRRIESHNSYSPPGGIH